MKKIIVVLIGAVCLLSSSAFAAGVPLESSSGNINLPGLWANYCSHKWGDRSGTSVNFTLENCIPGGASWNFYTYSDDTSKWNASLHLNGWYVESGVEVPESFSKYQDSSVDFSDVYLTSGLDIEYCSQEEALLNIYASHSISPASISSTSFLYNESKDPWRDLTRWNVDYYIRGYFIADTLAEAQAMGAPFVIPEPATVLLLGLGAISLMRRKPKS